MSYLSIILRINSHFSCLFSISGCALRLLQPKCKPFKYPLGFHLYGKVGNLRTYQSLKVPIGSHGQFAIKFNHHGLSHLSPFNVN